MTKNYTHLSLIQRYQIEALVKAGMKQKMIAANIGVDPSTVSRELARNIAQRGRTAGEYVASNAQRKTVDISPQSLPLISLDSLPAFHSKVYH
jgi:IS30 family transposase